jgi:hypothetical protein
LQQELEELQQQLEAQRQHCLAEQSELEVRTRESEALANELAVVRNRIEDESRQRRILAEKVLEVEHAKTDLAAQANAAYDLVKAHEDSIRSLEVQVRERQAEVDRLESRLQSEVAERRREQSQAEVLATEIAALNDRLTEKAAAHQRAQQRELELEQCLHRQQDQLASSAAAAARHEAELNRLRSTVDDMHVIQSALCARVRELSHQHDAASRRLQEWEDQCQAAARTIEARDRELAALRYAILEAGRLGTEIGRERLQVECQMMDGWKRLMTTLLHTPLSLAQRGLVGEIIGAFEGWRKGRTQATNGVAYQVEAPDLQPSVFNCTEVIESALAAVQKDAAGTGAKVQTALVGAVPERVEGNAQHIHQLITLLAASLARIDGAKHLELQVSFGAWQNGTADMRLSLLLSATGGNGTLCHRLTSLVESSPTLRTVPHEGPELALTAAWQLAMALGGRPVIDTGTERGVRLQISLPLQTAASLFSKDEPRQASAAIGGTSSQSSASSEVTVAGLNHREGD